MAMGLEVNESKTKVMTNKDQIPITICTSNIDYVKDYIYLGHLISFKSSTEKKIDRRIKSTWNKYWAMKEVFKGNLPTKLKTKAMNICLTPCLTYASQTWPITKKSLDKLSKCQRGMERSFLNLKLKDRIRNTAIRKKTKAKDAVKYVLRAKWKWAGHVQRVADERWSQIVTNWYPRDSKRRRGRPFRRWCDDIVKVAGRTWTRAAKERQKWLLMEEAFTATGGPYNEQSNNTNLVL